MSPKYISINQPNNNSFTNNNISRRPNNLSSQQNKPQIPITNSPQTLQPPHLQKFPIFWHDENLHPAYTDNKDNNSRRQPTIFPRHRQCN